jgi:hypothetical protein
MDIEEIKQQLAHNEVAIVEAQKRRNVGSVERFLAEDFHEIGSSGRLLSRAEVLDGMPEVEILEASFEQFEAFSPVPGVVILTYVTTLRRRAQGVESSSRAYRSSLWVEQNGGWRVAFHQASNLPFK